MPSPSPILFAHWGQDWIRGSERCLLDLIAHLDRERFTPVLLCNSQVLGTAARALDVPVLCDERYRPRDSFLPDWRLAAEARQILRRHRIQLVHVNNIDLVKWLLPAARTARIPMVAHIHLPSPRIERCYTWAHQVARVVAVSRSVARGFPGGWPRSGARPGDLQRGRSRAAEFRRCKLACGVNWGSGRMRSSLLLLHR